MRPLSLTLLILATLILNPLTTRAELFENNDQSCQDIQVTGSLVNNDDFNNQPLNSQSIACGRFNDDTDLGDPNFPDCATQRDPIPATSNNNLPVSNSILINTGAQQQNCINAGEPNKQFEQAISLNNQGLSPMLGMGEGSPIRMGNIQSGNLDNKNFEDLAFTFVFDKSQGNVPQQLQLLFSLNGGGFGAGNFTPDKASLFDANRKAFPADVFGDFMPLYDGLPADRTLILMDCNGDKVDDAVSAVKIDSDTSRLIVFSNDGNGNMIKLAGASLPFLFNQRISIALASADFDNDGILDIAAIVNSDHQEADPFFFDQITLCKGDGMCGFTCGENETAQIADLAPLCINDGGVNCSDPFPMSVISGDFNGDALPDLALSEAGSSDVRYFFNDGENNLEIANWPSQRMVIPALFNMQNTTPRPLVITKGRFTVEAYSSHSDEIALSVPRYAPNAPMDFGETQLPSTLAIISSDGNGAINNPLVLSLPEQNHSVSGIEARNFDLCGGDDLIALSSKENARFASVYINFNEIPLIQAPTDLVAEANQALPIAATCEDPTEDKLGFSWTPKTVPAGAQVNLGVTQGLLVFPQNDASTSFQGDLPGDYEIELNCNDACAGLATHIVKITIKGEEGSGSGTGTDTGGDTSTGGESSSGAETTGSATTAGDSGGSGTIQTSIAQGSCVASLNPAHQEKQNFKLSYLIYLIPLLAFWLRRVSFF